MERWVKTLPGAEKDAYLVRFLAEEGDVLLRAELAKRFAYYAQGYEPPSARNRGVVPV